MLRFYFHRSALRIVVVWGLTSVLASAMSAQEAPSLLAARFENPVKRGDVEVRWLGIPIYSAALFTSSGKGFSWSDAFGLELRYKTGFSQENLLKASKKELVRMEGPQSDHGAIVEKLATCYRDVGRGDRFLAVGMQPDLVEFLFNGSRTCLLDHQNIRQRLLGIWLSDQARQPKVSQRLRGGE